MALSTPERTRHFYKFAESVNATMDHPNVIATLGSLTGKILEVNNNLFLPEEHDGKLVVPEHHRGNPDAVALIPISIDESTRVFDAVQSILSTEEEWQKLDNPAVSPISGVTMTSAAIIKQLNDRSENRAERLKSSSAVAIAGGACKSGSDNEGNLYVKKSPAIIIAKVEPLEAYDQWNTAATIAHEEVHVADRNYHPPLFGTPAGNMGSELVGWEVSDELYNMTDQPAEGKASARKLAEWRKHNMPANAPYILTEEQIVYLRELGV
ncbi:MAG TPA: hypothetical protein VFZ58_04355 [Candidatus Saccharimonadales bacterium]